MMNKYIERSRSYSPGTVTLYSLHRKPRFGTFVITIITITKVSK